MGARTAHGLCRASRQDRATSRTALTRRAHVRLPTWDESHGWRLPLDVVAADGTVVYHRRSCNESFGSPSSRSSPRAVVVGDAIPLAPVPTTPLSSGGSCTRFRPARAF